MKELEMLELSCYRPVAVIDEAHGVYLVQHSESRKIYILKKLTRYHREIYTRLMERPVRNMPQILDLWEADGVLLVVEEYVSGQTLQEALDSGRRFSQSEVLSFGHQLCAILSQLHQSDPPIIHRDLKPSNVILRSNGTLCLLDLDAAKYYTQRQAEDTHLLGTVGFAAPEQFGFGGSSPQTDLYGLGVLLNVLLTGGIPKEEPAQGLLAPVIRRATQLKPEDRYASAEEMDQALSALEGGNAGPRRWAAYLPPGFRQGNPMHMLVAALGYTVWLWLAFTIEPEDPNLADRLTLCLLILVSGGGIILFSGNYLGIQDRIPWLKNRHPLLRACLVAGLDLLFFLLALLFFALISAILAPV